LAVIRQIFNHARYVRFYTGASPIENVKFPQADNRRLRFLNQKEAKKLLPELKRRSQQLYEIALLSLKTGARADEIFSLKWSDVDFDNGTLTLWDTKNTKTRMAFMPEDVRNFLSEKLKGNQNDFVFPRRGGGKIVKISKSFDRPVQALGFNSQVTDRRMKVVFHTLRHTYASWLVEQGTDLYTVKGLMGTPPCP
jgi:integrase